MTQQPRTRTQITDETGQTVAANVRRVREQRGLSTYELSRKLKQVGRPIAPSALAKVERAERRVDVGDLMALAAVLNVSPSALLLPPDDSPRTTVEITGAGPSPADAAWAWANGRRPLRGTPGREDTDALEYQLYSLPPGQRRDRQHPVGRALEAAEADIQRVLHETGAIVEGDRERFAHLVDNARRSLARLAAELDHAERDRGDQIAELDKWKANATRPKGGEDGPSVD